MLFSASKRYVWIGYITLAKSHLFHTSKVCIIWPASGILKGSFWNISVLNPTHYLDTLFSHERITAWTRFWLVLKQATGGFILKHKTKNWSMIPPTTLSSTTYNFSTGTEEIKNIPRTIGGATIPAYIWTFQYPQRTCVQLADPTVWRERMLA